MAMQLASYGTRGVGARSLARALGFLKPPNNGPSQTTKNLISRFVSHLTAPGLAAPRIASHGPSASVRHFSGATGSNLYGRHALSFAKGPRFHVPHGARLPVSRGVGDVGLGAARKFSSSGPLFAVVENVPILLRAGYQADWDTKHKKSDTKRRVQLKQAESALKARSFEAVKSNSYEHQAASLTAQDFENYFAKPTTSEVDCAATLVVPLVPTRQALGALSAEGSRLLDISSLASTHESHTKHRMRVSSLFSRLDLANVWTFEGVTCHPFTVASPGEVDGQATHLKITFPGWTAARVRKVIGDSGFDWCDLSDNALSISQHSPSESGSTSPRNSSLGLQDSFDDHAVSDTLELPTIDLGSALFSEPESQDDWLAGSDSDDDWDTQAFPQTTAPARLGFSASFTSGTDRARSWDSDWTASEFSDQD